MAASVILYRHRENTINRNEKQNMFDAYTSAAALYDGGWRAEDKNQIIEEYGFSDAEAEHVCEYLKEFAEQ